MRIRVVVRPADRPYGTPGREKKAHYDGPTLIGAVPELDAALPAPLQRGVRLLCHFCVFLCDISLVHECPYV